MKWFLMLLCFLGVLVSCSDAREDIVDVVDEVCTEQYDPVCAQIQVQCITTPCDPVQETYSNECYANQAGAEILYPWKCTPEPTSKLPEGTFTFNEYGNFYGELYLQGYIQTKMIPEAFCEENCEEYETVWLTVTQSGNDDFAEFLEKNAGNGYLGNQEHLGQVMLGCLREDGSIGYENHSDTYGVFETSISGDTASDILAHDRFARQMVLKLTKLPLSGGRGAPTCYSHFYDIELVDALNVDFGE